MRVIESSSRFIDILFEEEIDLFLTGDNTNVSQLATLTRAREMFTGMAEAMRYVLME
jgi:hypothetical protein